MIAAKPIGPGASPSQTPIELPTIPQTFRWQLVGSSRLPDLTEACKIGVALRAAVQRAAERRGMSTLPDAFHHSKDHSHAFWIPEDVDVDGRVDHVMVFAESGLPKGLIPVLAEADKLFLGRRGEWQLIPNWMGRRSPGGVFGPAKVWRSMSAYVPPWWQKRGKADNIRSAFLPVNQLRREIVERRQSADADIGLPAPVEINVQTMIKRQLRIPAQEFVIAFRDREHKERRPRDSVPVAIELSFDRPVWGPLAFGFGAHFGLGVFEPVG